VRPRIGLTALALRPGGGGVQTYMRELIAALPDVSDVEFVVSVQADAAGELPATVEPRVMPVAAGVRRAALALRTPPDVVLVHGLDVALPARHRVPTVATIHDLSVFDVPWSFRRRQVAGRRLQLRHAARSADVLIADSAFTAQRVRDRLGRDATVIPLAPASDSRPPTAAEVAGFRRRYDVPDRFVLHVGTSDPRKDLKTLAAACHQAALPLVLAGARPVSEDGLDGPTQRLGYVPRADLAALYGAATIVAYPSRYEGFGLPPLEAMACGAPVIASAIAPLTETLGDAAVLVPTQDVDALAEALQQLWDDESHRRALVVAGLERARRFTWRETARLTADVYRSLGVPS
jgi:glycosyltransferase involved in cell wall biosynthesis